jgi:hypothetical protein
LIQELNDDFDDITARLDFTRVKGSGPAQSSDPKIQQIDQKGKSYDLLAYNLKQGAKMATPALKPQTEHDLA